MAHPAAQASGRHKQGRPLILKVLGLIVPGLGFGCVFGYLSGEWLVSIVLSMTISANITLLYELDRSFVQPRIARQPRDRRLVLEIAFSLAEHLVGALAAYAICFVIFDFEAEAINPRSLAGFIGLVFIASLIIHSTGYALSFYRELKEKEVLEERLRSLAAQAELKALKAQIDPHFLFNTLNTIADLTHSDPSKAEATIERLAEMFRYVLLGSERGLIKLEQELAFVDSYLEIERARFGERLRVDRLIDPQALDTLIPSLTLQPLVENAVRHGQGKDGCIHLTIQVQRQPQEVTIAFSDQGPGMPPGYTIGNGQGHGLSNVDERLRKIYGPTYGLEASTDPAGGAFVRLRIPCEGMAKSNAQT